MKKNIAHTIKWHNDIDRKIKAKGGIYRCTIFVAIKANKYFFSEMHHVCSRSKKELRKKIVS
jgi:hypothetical protein